MNRDLEYLVQFEKKLMELEEAVHRDHTENFQSSIATIRRELLILRGYYDEIMDAVADFDMVNAKLDAILSQLTVEEF